MSSTAYTDSIDSCPSSHDGVRAQSSIEPLARLTSSVRCTSLTSPNAVLHQFGKCLDNVKVTIMDLAHKKIINDTWESPAIISIEEVVTISAEVWVFDHFIPLIRKKRSCVYVGREHQGDAWWGRGERLKLSIVGL